MSDKDWTYDWRAEEAEDALPRETRERIVALRFRALSIKCSADILSDANWKELDAIAAEIATLEKGNPCPGCGADKGPYPDSPSTNLCGACRFGRPRTD